MNAESEAICRCCEGDSDAFGEIVRRFQAEAIGHALVLLGNREDALDAVQEAFLDAYRGLARFDRTRQFYPWFYTILRNRCLKILDQKRRDADIRTHLRDYGIGTNHRQQTEQVEIALAALSPEEREIVTLKHLDGLSYQQLTERLGIPIGTVMSRLYYARRRMRQQLERGTGSNASGKGSS